MANANEQSPTHNFFAWLEEGQFNTPEVLSPDWGKLRIEVEEIAVLQLERLAEFRRRAAADATFWLDAVRSSYLALTAVMVAALEGPAGVGAMRDKAAGRLIAYWQTSERAGVPFPREDTMSFTELITAIQSPGRLQYGNVIKLTDGQKLRAKDLNDLRELIDHPKFTRWFVTIEEVEAATMLTCELFERIIACAPQRFFRSRVRVEAALNAITSERATSHATGD